jgi:hypothetical protein
MASLKVDKYTHSVVPFADLVSHFLKGPTFSPFPPPQGGHFSRLVFVGVHSKLPSCWHCPQLRTACREKAF